MNIYLHVTDQFIYLFIFIESCFVHDFLLLYKLNKTEREWPDHRE